MDNVKEIQKKFIERGDKVIILKEQPLISIIVPIYNTEKHLPKCIESILNQTYKKLEIILVNDGSTDRSLIICQEFAEKDKRIIVISQKNEGVSSARNRGLDIASGEYIGFVDSDDYIEKDAMESLLSEGQYHSADVVFFESNTLKSTSGLKYQSSSKIRKGFYSNIQKGTEALTNLLKNKEFKSPVWRFFIHRDLLEKNKLIFYPGIQHEDELFTFKLFLYSEKIVHLTEPLYNRRIRKGSIMMSPIRPHNFISMLIIANEMITTYLTECKSAESKEVVKNHIAWFLGSVENRYYKLPLKDRIVLFKDYKELIKKLENNEYLNNQEIRKKCQNLSVINFEKELKKLLPKRIKEIIKEFFFTEKHPYEAQILTSLKKTVGNKRIILIGTPIHGNVGDHAIAVAERQLLNDYLNEIEVIEIVMPVYRSSAKKIKSLVTEKDVLIIQGGGYLGTLWQHNEDTVRSIIKGFPHNQILIMPQTVYFENTEIGFIQKEKSKRIFYSHQNLTICLRDSASYQFILQNKFIQNQNNCIYLPDAALALNHNIEKSIREGALLCFRNDRENIMDFRDRRNIKNLLREMGIKTNFTTNAYLQKILLEDRNKALEEKLREYSSAKIVITDRLHGMIFAAITGTPCIAFDNISSKVSGVYSWIKDLEYIRIVSSVEEATAVLPILLEKGAGKYDNSKIKKQFKKVLLTIAGEN